MNKKTSKKTGLSSGFAKRNDESNKIPEKALTVHKGGADMNIEALIGQAINKGTGIETMEKLLAMRKELKAEWARSQYFASLTRFQSKCPEIKKTQKVMGKNGGVRYKFAPLDAIIKQVQPLLEECGLSFSIHPVQTPTTVKAVCRVHHLDGHSEETEFEIPIDPDAYMNAAQQVASALTYAKRYSFCNALGIMTADEDDDARETDWEGAAGNADGQKFDRRPEMEVCPKCGAKKVIPSKYDSGKYCLGCKAKLPAGERVVTPAQSEPLKPDEYARCRNLYAEMAKSGLFSDDELAAFASDAKEAGEDAPTLSIVYGEMKKAMGSRSILKTGKKPEPKEQDIF